MSFTISLRWKGREFRESAPHAIFISSRSVVPYQLFVQRQLCPVAVDPLRRRSPLSLERFAKLVPVRGSPPRFSGAPRQDDRGFPLSGASTDAQLWATSFWRREAGAAAGALQTGCAPYLMSHRLEDCLPRDFDFAFPCTRFGRRGSLVPNQPPPVLGCGSLTRRPSDRRSSGSFVYFLGPHSVVRRFLHNWSNPPTAPPFSLTPFRARAK